MTILWPGFPHFVLGAMAATFMLLAYLQWSDGVRLGTATIMAGIAASAIMLSALHGVGLSALLAPPPPHPLHDDLPQPGGG